MKTTFLRIDKPCSENWEKMSQNETGNYCHLCSKTVLDFTKLTQVEISKKLKKGNVCARVTKEQLNAPLLPVDQQHHFNWPYSNMAASLLLATTAITIGQPLQEIPQKPQIEISQKNGTFEEKENNSDVSPTIPQGNNFITIKGLVKSELNKPLKNVKIIFVTLNRNFFAYSLENGTFSIEIPTELIDDDNVLRVKYNEIELEKDPKYYFPYENRDFILTKAELNSVYNITAPASRSVYLGGIGSYSEYERIPIVINNGQEIKYKEFIKAQQGKKSSCNLENKDYDYFEPAIAVAIYGKKAKYGLYILKDKEKK